MTGCLPTPEAVGGIALLERAITYTLGGLRQVTPESLVRPTPCAGWNLRDLLAHLDDSLLALCEAGESGRIPVRAAGRPVAPDPVGTVRDRARRLLEVWAAADRPAVSICGRSLTAAILTGTGALEVVVHGWDITRTCGAPRAIPGTLAEELLDLAPLLVTDGDRPGRFGAPVELADRTAPGDRLVALLGRHPAWAPPEETTARAA